MKINLDIDYETVEYTQLISGLGKMLNRIMDTIDKNNEMQHERKIRTNVIHPDTHTDTSTSNFNFEPDEDSSEEDSSEEDDSLSQHVEHSEVSDAEIMVMEGCEVYEDLMNDWLVNFMTDETQPDRVEMLRNLSISRNGFRILAYLQSKKSLTLATLDYLEKYDIDSPSGEENSREFYARQIAEHLSQVSSIIFYQISDFLQYPNPLEK